MNTSKWLIGVLAAFMPPKNARDAVALEKTAHYLEPSMDVAVKAGLGILVAAPVIRAMGGTTPLWVGSVAGMLGAPAVAFNKPAFARGKDETVTESVLKFVPVAGMGGTSGVVAVAAGKSVEAGVRGVAVGVSGVAAGGRALIARRKRMLRQRTEREIKKKFLHPMKTRAFLDPASVNEVFQGRSEPTPAELLLQKGKGSVLIVFPDASLKVYERSEASFSKETQKRLKEGYARRENDSSKIASFDLRIEDFTPEVAGLQAPATFTHTYNPENVQYRSNEKKIFATINRWSRRGFAKTSKLLASSTDVLKTQGQASSPNVQGESIVPDVEKTKREEVANTSSPPPNVSGVLKGQGQKPKRRHAGPKPVGGDSSHVEEKAKEKEALNTPLAGEISSREASPEMVLPRFGGGVGSF